MQVARYHNEIYPYLVSYRSIRGAMFSYKRIDGVRISFFLLLAVHAAMEDGDILLINRPLAAYISLGKLVLRMRSKISIARSETTCKRAGSRHWGSKLSQPTVHMLNNLVTKLYKLYICSTYMLLPVYICISVFEYF